MTHPGMTRETEKILLSGRRTGKTYAMCKRALEWYREHRKDAHLYAVCIVATNQGHIDIIRKTLEKVGATDGELSGIEVVPWGGEGSRCLGRMSGVRLFYDHFTLECAAQEVDELVVVAEKRLEAAKRDLDRAKYQETRVYSIINEYAQDNETEKGGKP